MHNIMARCRIVYALHLLIMVSKQVLP